MTKNQIDYWRLQEDMRANRVNEAETQRSNRAREEENYRSNLARETETHRTNVANEGISFGNLSESERSHMASEDIQMANLAELTRHQQVVEAETNRANIAKELENYRHNTIMEAETRRSNIADESINAGYLAEKSIYDISYLTELGDYHQAQNNIEMLKVTKKDEPDVVVNNLTTQNDTQSTRKPNRGDNFKGTGGGRERTPNTGTLHREQQ